STRPSCSVSDTPPPGSGSPSIDPIAFAYTQGWPYQSGRARPLRRITRASRVMRSRILRSILAGVDAVTLNAAPDDGVLAVEAARHLGHAAAGLGEQGRQLVARRRWPAGARGQDPGARQRRIDAVLRISFPRMGGAGGG